MAILDSLKVVTYVKPTFSPITHRRRNLVEKLQHQIGCVKAKQEGRDHFVSTVRTVKNDAGVKAQIERTQKIRPWWFRGTDGKVVFEVRYANKRIELAKGKTGIEVDGMDRLIPVIELVIQAVESGELDKALGLASTNFRSQISKD